MLDAETKRAVFWVDYGVVKGPATITKANKVKPGAYILIVHQKYGKGSADIKIVDVTASDQAPEDATLEGKKLFEHNGSFGPMLVRNINV